MFNIEFTVCVFLCVFVAEFHNTLAQSRCRNPNQNVGYCVSIYDCQPLLDAVSTGTLSEMKRKFIRNSECDSVFGKRPHVCCTHDTGYIQNNRFNPSLFREVRQPSFVFPRESHTSTRKTLDIPTQSTCGAITFQNKIYGGEDTDIKEFPWMVLLEYRKRNGALSFNCGGSIINHRYVLTAAHCVTGAILTEVGPLKSVRAGEFDTSKNVDCNESECADPVSRFGIDEIIPHPEYNDKLKSRHNDIALIRLNRNVDYTDSIKPVCLPFVVENRSLPVGLDLIVAGWGRTLRSSRSQKKQKVTVPHFDFNECQRKFKTRNVDVSPTQICAGGNYAEDSCDGDSGGPLMSLQGSNWVIEGIVSFGVKCGINGWPAVHTKVASFESWIKSKLR